MSGPGRWSSPHGSTRPDPPAPCPSGGGASSWGRVRKSSGFGNPVHICRDMSRYVAIQGDLTQYVTIHDDPIRKVISRSYVRIRGHLPSGVVVDRQVPRVRSMSAWPEMKLGSNSRTDAQNGTDWDLSLESDHVVPDTRALSGSSKGSEDRSGDGHAAGNARPPYHRRRSQHRNRIGSGT